MPTVCIKDDQNGRGRGVVASATFSPGDRIAPYISKLRTQSELKAIVDKWNLDGKQFRGPALTGITDVYDFVSEEVPGAVYVGHVPLKADGQINEANACLINDVCSAALIRRRYMWRTVRDVQTWARDYRIEILHAARIRWLNVELVEIEQPNQMGAPPQLWALALTSIRAGDDLFTAYGASYWIGHLMQDKTADARARLSAVLFVLTGEARSSFPVLGVMNGIYECVRPLNSCRRPYDPSGNFALHLWNGIDATDTNVDGDTKLTSHLTNLTNVRVAGPSEQRLDALCDTWLRLVGFDSAYGQGYAAWVRAIESVCTHSADDESIESRAKNDKSRSGTTATPNVSRRRQRAKQHRQQRRHRAKQQRSHLNTQLNVPTG